MLISFVRDYGEEEKLFYWEDSILFQHSKKSYAEKLGAARGTEAEEVRETPDKEDHQHG